MTRHLRQLLGMGHIDEHGHNVIEVNRLDAAIVATETEQERLTLELAKARGRTVQQTRWDVLGRTGSGDWLEPLGDPEGQKTRQEPPEVAQGRENR